MSIIIGLVFACFLGEVTCRLFLNKRCLGAFLHYDERNLLYKYDKELGWFSTGGSERYFTGSRKIFVKNNSLGFRDRDHELKTKPRIIFLGDSFVWGFDVEQEERFTEKLQRLLPGYEILNFGVSGYGTDQEYLTLKKYFYSYKPDIVFLMFDGTDRIDNSINARYGGYYKPYFIIQDNKLVLKGVPVPKSQNYYYDEYPIFFKSYLFNAVLKAVYHITSPTIYVPDPTENIICEMNSFLKANNSTLIIGFVDEDPHMELNCMKNNIPYITLRTPYRYTVIGEHWTPEGHSFVCSATYDFLLKNGYIENKR